MQSEITYLHCGEPLRSYLKNEIDEILQVVELIKWEEVFQVTTEKVTLFNQRAYNKIFQIEFEKLGWESQSKLSGNPNLIGGFQKNFVLVEVQFGRDSATLYRDFYKFQDGQSNGPTSLKVLIVPSNPKKFFPTRPNWADKMADYDLAVRYFSVLPISVPTMIIGLVPN